MMDRESRALHCADRRAPGHERNSLNGIEVTARRRCCCWVTANWEETSSLLCLTGTRLKGGARVLINVLHSVTVGKKCFPASAWKEEGSEGRTAPEDAQIPLARRKILATLPGKRRSEIESQPWGPRSDNNTEPHRRLGRGEAGTYNP